MREVRIYALHPSCKDIESFIRYTKLFELKDKYNLVWTDCNPKILIATEHIYTNSEYYKRFKQLYRRSEIKVFFSGEACATDYINFFEHLFSKESLELERVPQGKFPNNYYRYFFDEKLPVISRVRKTLGRIKKKNWG